MSFQILTVCTGNICRSPAAQLLLQNHLDQSVTVDSAGTYAMRGYPIHEPMATLLENDDIKSDTFFAKQLTPKIVQDSNLIVTATFEHRSRVLEESPAALKKAYTLLEFTRTFSTCITDKKEELRELFQDKNLTDAEKLTAIMPLLAKYRRPNSESASADEISDPYRRSDAHYRQAYDQISVCAQQIADLLHSL